MLKGDAGVAVLLPGGKQPLGLAAETAARGQQEAEIDQDEQEVGDQPLQGLGHPAGVLGRVQLARQVLDGRRGMDMQPVGHVGDDGVQPRGVGHQLTDKAGGVAGDQQHRHAETGDRHQ